MLGSFFVATKNFRKQNFAISIVGDNRTQVFNFENRFFFVKPILRKQSAETCSGKNMNDKYSHQKV